MHKVKPELPITHGFETIAVNYEEAFITHKTRQGDYSVIHMGKIT